MKNLLDSYLDFCNFRKDYNENSKIIVKNDFLTPTHIIPLYHFITTNDIPSENIIIENQDVHSYFENIIKKDISSRSTFTYIPLTRLPEDHTNFDSEMDSIYNILKDRFSDPTPLFYIFQELINNIYDHSEFTNAFFMAQEYKQQGLLDFSFFDDGLTIPRVFRNSGIGLPEDVDCIYRAWKGVTTRPDAGRGKGIRSSYNICTNQYEGEFLIISGKGILDLRKPPRKHKPNDPHFHLNGTMISARCKFMEPKGKFIDNLVWE
ncbi:sensor histidine kinase [Candidatus Nitrosocosmicus sp. SS]|jgi:hypothetical protein|uniref:sensor histidine kinase n=1 Tax=Candidatus Nitrosocosmicus agrestis TaxID=2563600 RepID=UPI00122E846D|nr:sensor histidine kinase [Candidatus Nitrosocosmicus sp. SS]KAA2281228.1 sensor histidine kinase [Candidatus Nitrosocosmicus sp. SS]KAF0868357.1 sensor histidine kinase [Candidatus Nitrosocosmicus sp. SS]MDR4490504.1 hypothetical protein [Candidatus Nitrosocosmicus sp.]